MDVHAAEPVCLLDRMSHIATGPLRARAKATNRAAQALRARHPFDTRKLPFMRLQLISPAFVLLAACGSDASDPDKNILNATAQMDPAAAAAVQNAVQNGVDPQKALAIGGAAQVGAPDIPSADDRGQPVPPQVQAKPNIVQDPNRKDGTVPPDKIRGTTNQPGLLKGGRETNDQPSGGQR